MESWLTRITDYLLTQSWQIAVLTVVVAAASFFLRNRSAHVRYLLWLVVLAKCLVPPVHTIPLAILPQEKPPALAPALPRGEALLAEHRIPQADVTEHAGPISVEAETTPVPEVTQKRAAYNIRAWLAIGWFVGAMALFWFYLLNAVRTQIWLLRQRKALPVQFRGNIDSFFTAHRVRRTPRIWLLERISQPFVWGPVRGSIYLPAKRLDGRHAKFQASLLAHELSHVMRFDAAVNSLQVIAQTVFWFHPFVWWANRKIRAEREKCCDEMTIARLNTRPEDYGEAIVETIGAKYEQARPVPSLAVAGPAKNIEERIKTMLTPEKKFYKRPSLTAAIVVFLAALLIVPTALVLTARARTETDSTPLHQAVAAGDIEQVKSLISKGADVNARDNEGRTPLFYAVKNDYILMLDLLIVNGADINAKDTAGNTPLHHAARVVRYRDWQFAAELARRGAHVNATNNGRQTPLHVALEGGGSGHRHVVSMLLNYDVNVNARDSNGKTALHLAAQRVAGQEWEWQGVLPSILAKAAEVNLTDAKGQTALHIACNHKYYNAEYVLKTIFELGKNVNPNVVDNENATPLHIAALRGQRDACELLIGNGAKVDAKDNHGHTPTYYAVRAANVETADSLIKNGADTSSIHLSAYTGNISNLKKLITGGASANEKDETGFRPLHAAALGGHRGIVEYLISQGADVKAEGEPGWTALSYAARGNHKQVLEVLRAKGVGGGKEVSRLLPVVIKQGYADVATVLIALGADINVNDGEPLRMAVLHGYKDIVELLISKGADVNVGGKQSPLHAAAASGRIDIAECLIAAGADIDGKNKEWWSPLGDAITHRHKRMVEFLLSKGAKVNKGSGWWSIQDAINVGDKDIAKVLIEYGAYVNQGMSVAAWYQPEFVELLIDNGANVNRIAPMWAWTPLHWSVYGDNRDAFDLLVLKGADVNVRTHTKETVLHLLIQWGRGAEQVEFVLSRGVNINAADACGWTALHRAVLYNRPEIVELLVSRRADVNLKDTDGRTPLWLAKERRQERIVGLLRKHGAEE